MYRYADHDPILVGLHLGEDVTTDIEQVEANVVCTKVFRDGQIMIVRDGKTYSVMGQLLY